MIHLPYRRLVVFGTTLFVLQMLWSGPLQAQENGLAAIVNGRPITISEVDEVIKVQLKRIDLEVGDVAKRNELKAGLRKESLDSLIDRELMMAEYEKLSGGQPVKAQYVDEDIKEFVRKTCAGDWAKFLEELKKNGMTLKKFRGIREKMLIVQMMRSHATREVGLVTPEKKAAFLKEHPDMFREKDFIKLRSITVPKFTKRLSTTVEDQRTLIKEIRQRIVKGGDFASEARTYSSDSRAAEGGDFGRPIDRSQISSKLADAAFSLPPRTLSQIIEDEENFYLFYVDAKQQGKMKPTTEIEPELEVLVQNSERQKSYERWISRMRAKANIKRFM